MQLYADGKAYGEPVTVKAAEGWQYTFKNVPLYKEGLGERIDYNAKEVKVPDGYRFVEDQNHQGIGPEKGSASGSTVGTEPPGIGPEELGTGHGEAGGDGISNDQGIGPEEPEITIGENQNGNGNDHDQGIGPEEPGTATGGNQSGNGDDHDQGIGPEEPGTATGGNQSGNGDDHDQGIGPEEPGTETGGNQSGNGNGGDQGIGPEEPGSEAGGN